MHRVRPRIRTSSSALDVALAAVCEPRGRSRHDPRRAAVSCARRWRIPPGTPPTRGLGLSTAIRHSDVRTEGLLSSDRFGGPVCGAAQPAGNRAPIAWGLRPLRSEQALPLPVPAPVKELSDKGQETTGPLHVRGVTIERSRELAFLPPALVQKQCDEENENADLQCVSRTQR